MNHLTFTYHLFSTLNYLCAQIGIQIVENDMMTEHQIFVPALNKNTILERINFEKVYFQIFK